MKAVIGFLVIGALSACSGSPDGFRQEIAGGQGGSSDSERAHYDEVALTWDVDEEEGALGLIGTDTNVNPADYTLEVTCTLYGVTWKRSFSRGAGAIVPKDGQNCFAMVSMLTVTVDNTSLTFQPPSQEPFRSNVPGTQARYNTAGSTYSALVTLSEAFRIDLNAGVARVGFKFAITKDANASLAMNARSPTISWDYSCGRYGNNDVVVDSGQTAMLLNIRGSVCAPQNRVRDVALLIDVSHSMGKADRDPKTLSGGCGRHDSLIKVIESLKSAVDARLAIVTFATGVISWSGFQNIQKDRYSQDGRNSALETSLFQGLKTNSIGNSSYIALKDFVCERRTEKGTQVGSAMARVANDGSLRNEAQREVYIFTDGMPAPRPEQTDAAKVQATVLRGKGYKIGAVLLNNDPTIVREASDFLVGVTGNATLVKTVDKTQDIPTALQSLATNSIRSARYTLTNKNNAADIKTGNLILNNFTFSLPGLPIDTAASYNLQLNVTESFGEKVYGPHELRMNSSR